MGFLLSTIIYSNELYMFWDLGFFHWVVGMTWEGSTDRPQYTDNDNQITKDCPQNWLRLHLMPANVLLIICMTTQAWNARCSFLVRFARQRNISWHTMADGSPSIDNRGSVCQKQVSRTGTSSYIPQFLKIEIICPCPWYLLLTHKSKIIHHHLMSCVW